MGKANRDSDTAEITRRQDFVGIGEDGAHAQSAGLGIDLIVNEIDRSFVGKIHFVCQAQKYWPIDVAGRFSLALTDHFPNLQHRAFIDVEGGIHGIHRYDRGQQCLILHYQVAHSQVVSADAPVDGRHDLGEIKVEPVRVESGSRFRQ